MREHDADGWLRNSHHASPPDSGDSAGLTDTLEIWQEMIRLINQTRKDNGVPELPVSKALMNATQACSER